MAVTGYWFTKAISYAFGGTDGSYTGKVNWVADSASFKLALMHSSYTPAQTGQSFWADVSAYDVDTVTDVTGYTAGGKAIGTTTLTTTAGSNKTITFDSPDVVWTTATLTARYAVLYKDTAGAAATDPLVLYLDFGVDVPAVAGDFTVSWNSNGIATITVA